MRATAHGCQISSRRGPSCRDTFPASHPGARVPVATIDYHCPRGPGTEALRRHGAHRLGRGEPGPSPGDVHMQAFGSLKSPSPQPLGPPAAVPPEWGLNPPPRPPATAPQSAERHPAPPSSPEIACVCIRGFAPRSLRALSPPGVPVRAGPRCPHLLSVPALGALPLDSVPRGTHPDSSFPADCGPEREQGSGAQMPPSPRPRHPGPHLRTVLHPCFPKRDERRRLGEAATYFICEATGSSLHFERRPDLPRSRSMIK